MSLYVPWIGILNITNLAQLLHIIPREMGEGRHMLDPRPMPMQSPLCAALAALDTAEPALSKNDRSNFACPIHVM